jgi:hypothetical protein
MQSLNVQTLKYQYATLYGELVTEWLSAEQAAPALPDNVSEESEVIEQATRKEKLAQRIEWENYIFQPFETDQEVIKRYLQNLSGKEINEQAFKALEAIRASVEAFEASLAAPSQFNNATLKWIIEGLLGSDLLTEKRAVLKDFISNTVILSEVADVLNMRMTALLNWGWGGDIAIGQRRHLSGEYRVYMHEDVLQAIFLQFIGVKWSVFFKRTFVTFAKSDGAWTPLQKPIPKLDRKRREYFLGSQADNPSVQSKRKDLYMANYFMSKLLDIETQDVSIDDGDEECDYRLFNEEVGRSTSKKSKKRRHFREMEESSDGDGFGDYYTPTDSSSKNPMEIKQQLLHLLSTEILINTELHGEFTCVRSEFDNWGQTLPHSTIALVLTFFGVSNKWLDFFVKFLQAPLKFLHDDPAVQSQVRKRGVPESHVLSDVFGEAVLFCLDFSVNQVTRGGQLYRIHEEFWF